MAKLQREFFHSWIRQEAWTAPWKPPGLQGHRGFLGLGARENTLASLRDAKKVHLEMCEVDVQLTRDGIPVLYHDATLERLDHQDRKLVDLSWKEVQELAPQVPSLEEVFLSSETPPLLNLELKTDRLEGEALERKVAELVKKYKVWDRILFSSFNPASLWKIQNHLPQVPRAWIVSGADDEANHWSLKNLSHALYLRIHLFHFDQESLSQDFLKFVNEQCWRYAVWTVNSESLAKKYLEWGALSVITDELQPSSQGEPGYESK